MKNIKKILRKPAVSAGLLVLAACLLFGSAIQGVRAALTIESDYYNAEV